MRPMLARTLGPNFDRYPCFCQPKLNGVRALYQNGVFQSRDEKLWAPSVLAHLVEELSAFSTGGAILDGELYRHGWKLQTINGAVAVNRKTPRGDTPDVEFHVFDVVDPSRVFSARWFPLFHELLEADLPHVRPVATGFCADRAEVDSHFHLYTSEGYEGVMLRPDGVYEFGEHIARGTEDTLTTFRSPFLWKHKQWEDDEFLCIGTTPGEGKADIGIGALILRAGKEEFSVGTGFDDAERIAFDLNPPIGKRVRVRYLCFTERGVPFNPSFLAVLSD